MFSKTYTAALFGIEARIIEVEASIIHGLPKFFLVGLPNRAVTEARDRIAAAIKNSQLTMPINKITVNLAPADLPKEGSGFDLPITISLLNASRQIYVDPNIINNTLTVGELAFGWKSKTNPRDIIHCK